MKEKDIQNSIRIALAPYAKIFRINVGVFNTSDGRAISTGVPKGFSDLFGVRICDGKAIFIEVKTDTGRVREEQKHFLEIMKATGALAGIARNEKDALEIIGVNQNDT